MEFLKKSERKTQKKRSHPERNEVEPKDLGCAAGQTLMVLFCSGARIL
jgi:hypothetical protein